jgi:HAE1 family hydrophobic/amphiphilic exporter-1
VTLLALTLVIGILVDDAIVEIENIEKRVARGARPYQAAIEGADAIGLAVVATTMAIVVVFTPVSFMPGIPGQFFKEFGLTVSVAVLFSLAVARLITPLMAAYFLKPSKHPAPRKPFEGFYRNALEWALAHRIIASVVGGVIFIGSLFMATQLPQGFQPASDPDFIYVDIQGPPGATLQDMEATAQKINALFQKQPETTGVFVQVGSTVSSFGPGMSGGGSDMRNGTATILLRPDRHTSGDEIRRRLREELRKIPDARLTFLDFQGASGFQQILTGDNPANLQAAELELERQMRRLPQLADPRSSTPPVGPEIVIRPKPAEAARLGVSSDAIATIARVATVGDIDANVAKLNEGERRIPIRVRLPETARADVERIRSLRVPTASGGSTTLESVADITFQAGPGRIDRLNRQRQMTVRAELNGVEMGEAQKAVNNLPIMKHLPPGVHPAAIGAQQAMAAGMLPTAFALEKGAEFRQPMAVAVIGGLITSTLLSLVLVPVVYEFVDDFEQWLKPKLARLVTPPTAPARPAPEDRL